MNRSFYMLVLCVHLIHVWMWACCMFVSFVSTSVLLGFQRDVCILTDRSIRSFAVSFKQWQDKINWEESVYTRQEDREIDRRRDRVSSIVSFLFLS